MKGIIVFAVIVLVMSSVSAAGAQAFPSPLPTPTLLPSPLPTPTIAPPESSSSPVNVSIGKIEVVEGNIGNQFIAFAVVILILTVMVLRRP